MAHIALTMIMKDEVDTLRSCLDSIVPHVDEVVLVDTGSTDGTLEIASEYVDKVHHFDWVDDFSAARQHALDLVSDEADWIVWADADDVMENAEELRRLAETAPPHIDGYVMPYVYQRDPKTGSTMTELSRERLLRGPKSRWRWEGVVHEVLLPTSGGQPSFMVTEAVRYIHHRPETKETSGRNLALIEKYVERMDEAGEQPDPRMLVYLGSELMAQQRWSEAVTAFHRYIKAATWQEENYQAHHKLADCYRRLGQFDDAIITELKGFAIRDDWADGYYGLAETYYHKQDWDRVLRWLDRGDMLGPPKTLLITHPRDYDFLPLVYRSVALFNKGKVDEALEICEKALKLVPHDEQLLRNKAVFEEVVRTNKTVEAALNLSSELVVHDEPIKAMEVLNRLPHTVQNDPRVLDARVKTHRMIEHLYGNYNARYEQQTQQQSQDEDAVEHILSLPRYQHLLQDIGDARGLKILEVGCNDGIMACDLARRGHEVVACDLNERGIELGRKRAEEMGVADRVHFFQADVREIADTHEDFDVAYSFEVIEHVRDAEDFLDTITGLVTSGGIVAISTPDGVYDRQSVEALGLTPHREHVRVLPRHTLTNLIYTLDLGIIKTSERTEDRLSYVSFSTTRPRGRDVAIWCPFSYEEWGPHTLETGIGGSEEAVIHMAAALTARGDRVTVYGGWEGAHEGVLYHNHQTFDPYALHDIVVVWRTPTPVDMRIHATAVYIWMHDVPNPSEFTPERMERVNRVWVLSDWHRQCLPNVPDDKIEVIRNGVQAQEFPREPRDKHKVVWGSSPDRGLDKLLAVWGDVVEAVPDATLHCYYGFDMYDKMNRPPAFKQHVMGLVEKYKDSITWHGRVGKDELWEAFCTAGVWAYPTYFDEISCITAMRAQITGAWPVVVPKAALSETVKWGTKIDYDIHTDEGLTAFRDALIYELQNPVSDSDRTAMMLDTGVHFSWDSVADMWRDRFAADLVARPELEAVQ